LALVFGVVGGASAQTVLYTATVKPATVEVFCSPGNGELVYATNVLPQNTKVQVVEEKPGGWLAIKPPPNSFSIINKLFLEPKGNDIYLVTTTEDASAPVFYGHAQSKKPTAISVKLTRGTFVRAVGQPITADDGVWLPIEPPDREVRYIKAEAVTRDGGAAPAPPPSQMGAYQPSGGGQPMGAVPLVPPPSDGRVTPTPQAGVNPHWAEAERLERAGQIKEAIALYDKLGQSEVNHDYELAMRCYNRAGYLRRYLQTQPQTQVGYPATNDTRLRPVAAGTASQPTAQGYAPQCACVPNGQNVASAYYGQSVAVRVGRLRESGRQVNYQKTFVLETLRGAPIAYVNPVGGVNLQEFVNQIVELEGPMYWDGELRANHMTARSVTPVK
jgi:hypothetical protein